MTSLRHINRGRISIACGLVLALSAVAFALNTTPGAQRSKGSGGEDKNELIKRVEESPDQSLKILGNADSPLRVVEARVKEVPGALFTRLTGRTTDLAAVSTLPEAQLVNTSGQTVTQFVLALRDPRSRTTRGVVQSQVAIRPGETFVVTPEHFAKAEKVTTAGEAGQKVMVPGIESQERWIEFAARPDLFITVALVGFEDGSSWVIKEEGEVR